MIYFIEAISGDAVHIGRCETPREVRSILSTMQRGTPLELRVLGLLRSHDADIRAIHEELDPHRLRGDWFRLSGIRQQIRGWLAGEPLPAPPGKTTGFRRPTMTAMVEAVPEQAMNKIVDAVRAANGDIKLAAPTLGCTWRTLYRWIERIAERGLPIREALAARPEAQAAPGDGP